MFVDITSVGFTFLFVVLAFVLGLVLQFFLEMMTGMGSLFVGFAEAIAGGGRGGSSYKEPAARNKVGVFVRMVAYLGIIIAAFCLAASGLGLYAAVCAIFGGVALGLATIKLFSR